MQWDLEKKVRESHKKGDIESARMWSQVAWSKGFRGFNIKTMQLGKDDRLSNLAVLCPNHHRYVHDKDMGLLLLSLIPERER
jgi:hypothetical protein